MCKSTVKDDIVYLGVQPFSSVGILFMFLNTVEISGNSLRFTIYCNLLSVDETLTDQDHFNYGSSNSNAELLIATV